MDESARRYALRILLAHLALLAAVIALVVLASYEVYDRTREQIVHQAEKRQDLLARQTASAIDAYYTSILADLNLLRRTEENPLDRVPAAERPLLNQLATNGPPPRMFDPLWNQLEGRVSHLLYLKRNTLAVIHAFPDATEHESTRRILEPFWGFLRGLSTASVSPFHGTREGGANMIAVPVGTASILAAVVPVSTLEQQFLKIVSRDKSSGATLLDESGMVMATSDTNSRALVSVDPASGPSTRPVRRMMRRADMRLLKPGTTEQPDPTPIPGTTIVLQPRITTVEPFEVGGHTFYVVISSHLADITSAVNTMFTRALVGAVVVILCVTTILLSTAIRLIRSRTRLESLRHQMLTRELDQARAIQLHWLPSQAACPAGIQVAAANQTANHISGDFYDWFALPDGRAVVTIGDVTGHGMSAAFLMATTQLLVRTTLPQITDPAACLEQVNRQLCLQAFNGQFVTILLLVIDPQSKAILLATAGHLPPLLHSPGKDFTAMPIEPQLPLGIDPETAYTTETYSLPEGGLILLYTDGVLDAQSADGARFGLTNLRASVAASNSSQSLVDEVISAVRNFRGARPLSDDLTLVGLSLSSGRLL